MTNDDVWERLRQQRLMVLSSQRSNGFWTGPAKYTVTTSVDHKDFTPSVISITSSAISIPKQPWTSSPNIQVSLGSGN